MFVVPLAEPDQKAKVLHFAGHILSLTHLIQRQTGVLLNIFKIFLYPHLHYCVSLSSLQPS